MCKAMFNCQARLQQVFTLATARLARGCALMASYFPNHAAGTLQDRGEAPADASYAQVLAGLQLISTLAAAQLFDSLLSWRKASLKLTSTQQSDQVTILRKRVRRHKTLLRDLLNV